ncbi:MAG TPA: PLP-dependent aspartate aminotransferase family protein [Bacteroidia bacterium]|nr:PLP-dependent aspartate aminotransferase family protein [Bacteroidia bacterium]
MTTQNTNTRIIHSIPVDELTGAISVPIYQTSTYVQESPGVNKGFDYSRSNNPTRQALENLIAVLEHGSKGFAFASGLAAIDAVIKLLKSGDEILAVDDIYGGSFRIFTHIYEKFGIQVKYVDTTQVKNVADNITPKTKFIWIETPTNPTLKISDIEAIAQVAKTNNALLVVDNTFASPALQQPILLGADIVIHSATKYLGGHSDLIAGLVVTKTPELAEQIKFIQNSSGSILGPFDSWLVIRGIETLNLRVERHAANAQKIAAYLNNKKEIEKVYYPGLSSHPNHDVAKKQQSAFGSVISFSLKNDTIRAAEDFVNTTRLFKLAESLGGIKSLICHPAQMTHKSIPEEIRRGAGVSDSLIRLSVGLEDAEDLIDDLEQAFQRINANTLQVNYSQRETVC